MAIDSVVKRFSMMRFGSGVRVSYPTGSVDAAERLDFLGLYRGIAAAAIVLVAYHYPLNMDNREHGLNMDNREHGLNMDNVERIFIRNLT